MWNICGILNNPRVVWTAQVWSTSVRSQRSVVGLGDLPSMLNCSQFYSPKLYGRLGKIRKSQGVRGRFASRIPLQGCSADCPQPLAEDITYYCWGSTADWEFSVIRTETQTRPANCWDNETLKRAQFQLLKPRVDRVSLGVSEINGIQFILQDILEIHLKSG